MAYQAHRKKIFRETFELVDENGAIMHSFPVSLDPDSVVKNLSAKHVDLIRALKDVQSADPETDPGAALAVLGKSTIEMMEAVFGKQDAATILAFYNNRYMEMCQEVLPFITNFVIPEVRKIAKENKQQVLARYGRKKRIFGKRYRWDS